MGQIDLYKNDSYLIESSVKKPSQETIIQKYKIWLYNKRDFLKYKH